MGQTVLRIVDGAGNVGGEWYRQYYPKDIQPQIVRAKMELKRYQEAEPGSGWKLQTRGTVGVWHDWKE
jgi:hypothetical protein